MWDCRHVRDDLVSRPVSWCEVEKEKMKGGTSLDCFSHKCLVRISSPAAYLIDALFDPVTAKSQEPTETPFNRAYNTNELFWSWIYDPERSLDGERFGHAMRAIQPTQDFPEDGQGVAILSLI